LIDTLSRSYQLSDYKKMADNVAAQRARAQADKDAEELFWNFLQKQAGSSKTSAAEVVPSTFLVSPSIMCG